MRFLALFIAMTLVSATAVASTLRLALLYPEASAPDMRCALESSVQALKAEGFDFNLKFFPYQGITDLPDVAKKISLDKTHSVIGPLMSHEVMVTAPIFDKAQVTQFLPIASQPDLATKFPGTVRIISSAKHYAGLAAQFAVSTGIKSHVVIVANESLPYSTAYRDEFRKQLRRLGFGGKISIYNYLQGRADFSAAKKLADGSTSPTFFYAPIYAQDLAGLYFTLSNAKTSSQIFTHAGMFDAKTMIQKNPSQHVRVYFNGIWDQTSTGAYDSVLLRSIRTSCSARDLKPWTMAAWDALQLALATHKKHPRLTGVPFAQAARQMTFTGILGPWRVDELENPIRNLPVYTVDQSRIKLTTVVGGD